MNSVTWINNNGSVIRDGKQFRFTDKPSVGFVFDGLYYEPLDGHMTKFYQGATTILTDAEKLSCESFINGFIPPAVRHYVDSQGAYAGADCPADGLTEVPSCPPNDEYNYYWNAAAWVKTMGVDANGKFIGNAPRSECAELVTIAPVDEHQLWVNGQWVEGRSLKEISDYGIIEIDKAAGVARTRYITDAPGQTGAYIQKGMEADGLITGTMTEQACPHVMADAEIYNISPLEAATQIAAIKHAWVAKSAEIEKLRLGGKAHMMAAATSNVSAQTARESLNLILAKMAAI